MPLYEYRCRQCGDTFERLRSSSEADDPVACASGHDDTVRLLSLVARRSGAVAATPSAASAAPMGGMGGMGGGGCCGGGCCSA